MIPQDIEYSTQSPQRVCIQDNFRFLICAYTRQIPILCAGDLAGLPNNFCGEQVMQYKERECLCREAEGMNGWVKQVQEFHPVDQRLCPV